MHARHRGTALRNGPEQLTATHIPWALKPLRKNSDQRPYDCLFTDAQPDAGGKDFLQSLNPENLKVLKTYRGSSSAQEHPDKKFHFERIGYFVSDSLDHVTDMWVFNRGAG